MGYFELQKFQKGTKELAKTIAKTKSFSICGGGETAEAIKYLKLNQQFTHISTGGGASLEFLSGKILPGIKALETNYQQFKLKHSKKKKSIKNRYNLFF